MNCSIPEPRYYYYYYYYLDDQVYVWRGIRDGEDGRPGQGGLIHTGSVKFQEIFKLFRVQITVEVLCYLGEWMKS